MKKMFFTIAAFSLITTAAFCQEPTTLKSDNLKGNVFSVTISQYEFKENFGEPVEGNLRWKEAKIYNEEGKAQWVYFAKVVIFPQTAKQLT